jgi:hypothetical protein
MTGTRLPCTSALAFAAYYRLISLLDRIRRLLKTPEPDHPLTEEERQEHLPVTAFDVRASLEQNYVGRDVDPDEPRSGRV